MSATPEQWQVVKRILAGALEREPSERSAYLELACTDASVRREVESLIAAHDETDSGFLESPAAGGSGLRSGTRLGSYEITALLGAGGMGEVFQAHDTKLGRDVALKVLPPGFVDDSDRLSRFQREARILASLNHPNIATLHGLEQSDGVHYLVMELVSGRTLASRLAAGALNPDEALGVARQIAEALKAAHDKGVMHRDLKPANVKVTPEGRVKVLDFGLAKAFGGDAGREPSELATVSALGTIEGKIVGTPAYMSPEQAQGKRVDKRTDIWSFGCLLYELLSGERAFRGDNAAETIAKILEREPNWTMLPPATPARIRDLLLRCLQKHPEQRLPDIADAQLEIEEAQRQGSTGIFPVPAPTLFGRWVRVLAASLLALVVLGTGALAVRPVRERIHDWLGSAVLPKERQLAVLPFTNVGNDPASQAFCDGLVEILSSKLSQLEQFQKTLRVVPATDVLREGIVSVKEARQTFGVTLAITGSVQRADNRVRMTINLVDPQTLRQLKSKTIDTEVHDISALQDGVVLEAADLLDVRLTSEAKQVLAGGGTTVPDAYDLYAQGRGYLQRYDVPQNVDNAISLFMQALEQDHRYALAEAGLGEAYWQKYEHTKDSQWAEQAKKTSAAAIGLNNKLAQVYVTLGMIQTGTGDTDQAIGNLQRAVTLDPYNADAYRELAKAYEKRGRLKEAESTHKSAIAARPNYWAAHNELGGFYYHQGRYALAEKEFQTVVQLTPDNPRGYSNLGTIALVQKRYEEAAQMYEKSVAIKPTDAAYSNLGALYYSLGRYSDAALNFQRAVQMNDRDSRLWHNLAAAYKTSNEPEKAHAAYDQTARLAIDQLRVNPRDSTVLIRLADAYSMLDQPQRAREMLQRALALTSASVDDMFQAGVVYEQLRDRTHALEWISKAINGGYSRDLIDKSPDLAQLRLDPKFQSLLGP